MYEKAILKGNQAKAGRLQWRCPADTSLCLEQSGLLNPFGAGNKTALRRRHAIQHLQQWRAPGLMAAHEREARVDFGRCSQQSKGGINRTLLAGANGSGAATKQGELVWTDLVRTRQHQRAGDFGASMAERCVCALEATRTADAKEKAAYPEKRIVLSVVRTNRPLYKSVHRINENGYISVHRTYKGCFSDFPISVHRTPTSNTTPHVEDRRG